MQIALTCAKCGKIHTEETEGGFLAINFRLKQLSFICMNKGCRYENIIDLREYKEKSKDNPLPPTRIA